MLTPESHQKIESRCNIGSEPILYQRRLLGFGILLFLFSSLVAQSAQSNLIEEKAASTANSPSYPGADPSWQHFLKGAAKPVPSATKPKSLRSGPKQFTTHAPADGHSNSSLYVHATPTNRYSKPSTQSGWRDTNKTPKSVRHPERNTMMEDLDAKVSTHQSHSTVAVAESDASKRLQLFFDLHQKRNLFTIDSVQFRMLDSIYVADLLIDPVLLLSDPSIRLIADSAWLEVSEYRYFIPRTYYADVDGGKVRMSIPSVVANSVSSPVSFFVKVQFKAECIVESLPAYLKHDQFFLGKSKGGFYHTARTPRILMTSVIGVLTITAFFFVAGYFVARSKVSSLKYLREAEYRPFLSARATQNQQIRHIKVEPIHMNEILRKEKDLIQLTLNFNGRPELFVIHENLSRIASVRASIPLPVAKGYCKFFRRLYASILPLQRFDTEYYSLRIMVHKSELPQQLRIKNEAHMLLLGTNMSGAVLATDHQNFKISANEFSYSLFIDPAEIIAYDGHMDNIVIPFRVIEEPLDGYSLHRDFELTISNRNEKFS